MKENNEKEWIQQLKEDLEKLDHVSDPIVPQKMQLLNTLNEFKVERKRSFRREFILFLATALIILTTYIMITFRLSTTFFISIQGIAILVIPIIFIAERRRSKKNGVEHNGF